MSLEQTVVEIKNYSCRYGKEDALNLKGISLEVIDCGSGALSNFMKVSAIHKLDAIVLSHVHADHILDLFPLGYLLLERCMTADLERKLQRIPVFLPEGSESVLEGISEVLGHPKFVFTKPVQYGPIYEQFVNLVAGKKDFFSALLPKHPYTKDQVLNFGDLRVSFSEVNHGFPAFAMKFEYRGKIFVFSADTAPCEELAILRDHGYTLLLLDVGHDTGWIKTRSKSNPLFNRPGSSRYRPYYDGYQPDNTARQKTGL
jgi:ribonuclease BN (tRNA processing enzyme)